MNGAYPAMNCDADSRSSSSVIFSLRDWFSSRSSRSFIWCQLSCRVLGP